VGVALGGFGCRVELCGGYYTVLDGGLEAMLGLGPSYECSLYWGNTRPLEVVPWWFGSPVECARSWHVWMVVPYLCVFDNDHVTRYMGAEVNAGEHVDT